MNSNGMLRQLALESQKEKRPQKGGVGPKMLSTAGLIRVTIEPEVTQVKHFWGKSS